MKIERDITSDFGERVADAVEAVLPAFGRAIGRIAAAEQANGEVVLTADDYAIVKSFVIEDRLLAPVEMRDQLLDWLAAIYGPPAKPPRR